MLYSINRWGKIIEIEETQVRKTAYFDLHHGVFKTRNEASMEKLRRQVANRKMGVGNFKAPSDV